MRTKAMGIITISLSAREGWDCGITLTNAPQWGQMQGGGGVSDLQSGQGMEFGITAQGPQA